MARYTRASRPATRAFLLEPDYAEEQAVVQPEFEPEDVDIAKPELDPQDTDITRPGPALA